MPERGLEKSDYERGGLKMTIANIFSRISLAVIFAVAFCFLCFDKAGAKPPAAKKVHISIKGRILLFDESSKLFCKKSIETPAVVEVLPNTTYKLILNQHTGNGEFRDFLKGKQYDFISRVAIYNSNLANHSLKYLKNLKGLEQLHICEYELSEAGLKHIAEVKELKLLSIDKCLVEDRAVVHLAGLASLSSLYFYKCKKITGKGFDKLESLNCLTTLGFSYCDIEDRGLESVSRLSNIEYLDLAGCDKITDIGIKHLSKLKKLLDLELCTEKISVSAIASLKDLPALTKLSLGLRSWVVAEHDKLKGIKDFKKLQTLKLKGLTDEDLAHLKSPKNLGFLELGSGVSSRGLHHIKDFHDLRTLYLSDAAGVGDKGLSIISGMKGLQDLMIAYSLFITDEGIKHLVKLQNLKKLSLSYIKKITDEGLNAVSNMKHLEELILSGSRKITDKGLTHLTKLENLRRLSLFSLTNITDEGIEKFRKARPKCEVIR